MRILQYAVACPVRTLLLAMAGSAAICGAATALTIWILGDED